MNGSKRYFGRSFWALSQSCKSLIYFRVPCWGPGVFERSSERPLAPRTGLFSGSGVLVTLEAVPEISGTWDLSWGSWEVDSCG